MKPSRRISIKINTQSNEPKRVSILEQKGYSPTIPYISPKIWIKFSQSEDKIITSF